MEITPEIEKKIVEETKVWAANKSPMEVHLKMDDLKDLLINEMIDPDVARIYLTELQKFPSTLCEYCEVIQKR